MILAAALFLAQQTAHRPSPTHLASQTLQNARSALIVILDDVAYEDLQVAPTPVLDALAAKGTVYVNAYANGICSPTRRSIQTGRYWGGSSTGACSGFDPLVDAPLSQPFLSQIKPDIPSALFGKWHLGGAPSGGAWPLAAQERGYDAWRAGMSGNVKGCDGDNYALWRRCDDGEDAGLSTLYEPTETVEALTEWWDTIKGPRLAVWAPQLAHAPFHRPPEELIPGQPLSLTTRGKYEAMIQAFDTLLGEVVTHVNLSKDLVVVIGDNGTPENLVPSGFQGKGKTTTYRLGTHVPLYVLGLGQETSTVKTDLVHAVDIYPTIAELFSMLPGDVDGVSLLSGSGHPCVVTTGVDDIGVRSLTAFLRCTPDGDELYDTVNDADETVNLIDDEDWDEVEAELRLALDEFLAR